MGNILGLDLGTNSIGWAIRDIDSETEDQIVDYGVVIFKKGVGEGKSGEYSLAAERRTNRSKRRLYNAKRYRKWATLKVLSENGMCPISIEELRLWSVGNWQDGKNKGRLYPTSPDFIAWLAMDFNRIGKDWEGEKLKPAFTNTYELRVDLLENEGDTNKLLKIGRAFYHLAQRRGFKTSRKSGTTPYANNELFKKFKESHPDKADWKPSQIYLYIQSGKDPNPELRRDRIRNNAVIQRGLNEDEFFSICKKQNIDDELSNKIHKAIYFVRPLRTQKGLVGKCTLEKGKTRIPISHPAFEEFRALTYINNIQWRETDSKHAFESIPIELKKRILTELFFKPIERGADKGKINKRDHFEFKEIVDKFSVKGKYEFNYAKYIKGTLELKSNPTITACPVIAGLMNVFNEEWKNKFIADEDKFGIDWKELILIYNSKYNGQIVKEKRLDHEEIWHLLFDYLQTKDDEESLSNFSKSVLEWDDEKTTDFMEISVSQGYGSLSKSAIDKIIPFLQRGFIYSEAVSFANLSKVLGKEKFENDKENITSSIAETIKSIDSTKEKLNIVNSLIQAYFAEATTSRAKGFNGTIEEINFYKKEVENILIKYFGESNWAEKPDKEKKDYAEFITDKYLIFLSGKQIKEEKASAGINKNPEIDYYKLPRLDEAIKQTLKIKFNASDEGLKKLYHPSDIDIYPKAKDNWLEDPNPPSKGWKNPMAMRTMYELRKLVNYLLEVGKINTETKIVVEMARELNDANKRWAIQTYQRYREDENKEFAKAIIGLAKEKYPNINENDADNIDKVRLWWEQMENGEEVYKTIKALKEDVDKYRLWKEQGCQCIYTGKMIKLTDLFDGTSYDFEHTLPLSQSFDNSLANLTICEATYNRSIKKNQLPANLPNYNFEANGYSAIAPMLEKWIIKVEKLKDRIQRNKADTKKAIHSGNIEYKTKLIRDRHLDQFALEYWDKKVQTFTLTEMPNWWKNSQLVDTQIISKYARAYLKTLFAKVDVQKGSINAEFRNIYGIMGDDKKDRSKHSHHAKDAAVLTLIPGSAKREAILEKYYEAKENGRKYQEKPYKDFEISHVLKIEENVLINHITKDQTLSETKKKVRKRGKIEFIKDKESHFVKDENGKKIPLIMQGNSVRGQLHEQTYFGAIKEPERNENGFAFKVDGQYKIKQEKEKEVIRYVIRKDVKTLTIINVNDKKIIKENIVDTVLKRHLEKQLNDGVSIDNLFSDPKKEKKVRHIRVYHNETPIEIKKHADAFLSEQAHKHYVYAMNGENYLYLLYKGEIDKKIVTEFDLINLKTFIENRPLFDLPIGKLSQKEIYSSTNKYKGTIPCVARLKVGQKVIFFKENKEELKLIELKEIRNRIYKIRQLENDGRIKFDFHLEARKEDEIKKEVGDGKTKVDFETPFAKVRLSKSNLDFILEGADFKINPDGTINLLF